MKKLLLVLVATLCCLNSCQNPFLIESTKLYKVSFETNCEIKLESYRTSKIESIPAIEKEDATFVGWYTNAAFNGEAVTFPLVLTGDTTFYAKWNQKYTVTFETNGGTEITSYKTSVIREQPDTSRTDFMFVGWYDSADFGGEAITFPLEIQQATTLYAKWLEIHSVTFETNGGTPVESCTAAILTESPKTERDGYTFIGWYKETSLANQITFPYTVNSDMTLYAGWIDASNAIYQVKHYQQNTSLDGYICVKTETISGEAGKETQAQAQTYTGFTNKTFAQAAITEDNTTVIEIYYDRNLYTITFNANGGIGNTVTQTGYYGIAYSLKENSFIKSGFSFCGWAISPDGGVLFDDKSEYGITEDITLYAVWTIEIIPVNYYVKHYQQTTSLGDEYTLVKTETKTGYAGTPTAATAQSYIGFTAMGISQAVISANGNTVVEIYYDRNCYTVTFDANGGSGTMQEETFFYGVEKSLPANRFTKNGFSFYGWAETETGFIKYEDTDCLGSVSSDMILYAVWGKQRILLTANSIPTLDLSSYSDSVELYFTGAITLSDIEDLGEKIRSLSILVSLNLSSTTGLTEFSKIEAENFALYASKKIEAIVLPKSLTTIKAYAFDEYRNLKSIDIPFGVTRIEAGAFRDCACLESVSLPQSLYFLGEACFWRCSNLQEASIGKNISGLKSLVFAECTSLTTLYFNGTMAEWNALSKYEYAGSQWNSDVPAKSVICSDGTVAL